MKQGKRNLKWELIQLCKKHHPRALKTKRESFSTQANRKAILLVMQKQLKDGNFRNMGADSLKRKHVDYLVNLWKSENLSPATIKNRMSVLRWWADKVGKPNLINKSNDHYGITRRNYTKNVANKAKQLDVDKLAKIKDPFIRMAIELQKVFGLRREEAMKIWPQWAWKDDYLYLKANWCKGGRERIIPIINDTQREVLERAKKLAEGRSLIPYHRSYKKHMKIYERGTCAAKLNKNHGLRHRYARDRFFQLSGYQCPADGGKSRKEMTPEERQLDNEYRQKISRELGHERLQITSAYLGS